jgi:hypothetical protein
VDISSALNGATSYNLLVDLKKYPTIFAYSNVVWNGSKLTFATTAAENSTVAAGNVQGVYFRWGSLVAVSPVGNGYVAGSSIVFSPTGITNYAWGSIPYADETGAPFANDAATDDDFAGYNGSGYNASAGKGDICRYITAQGWVSGSWRLPKGSELTALIGEKTPIYYGTWTSLGSTPGGGNNAYGYYQPSSGVQLGTENLTFPASGLFTGSGNSNNVGAHGYFWSGTSAVDTNNALIMSYYSTDNYDGKGTPMKDVHTATITREVGIPVRCVRIN